MPKARISSYRIHYNLVGDSAVLRPEGPCDERRTEALARLANTSLLSAKHVILDLSRAPYVESPGFRWIVRQVRSLEATGRTLIVVGLSPSVERTFRLLRLDRIVRVAGDVTEALRLVEQPHESLALA
mgnify:CR=1 FL=1